MPASAHRDLEGRKTAGKLMLTVLPDPHEPSGQADARLRAAGRPDGERRSPRVDFANNVQQQFEATLERADEINPVPPSS